MRFEDYTRRERAALMLKDTTAYLALLGADELYLLLDGLGHIEPYKPEPVKEESWRTLLRKKGAH